MGGETGCVMLKSMTGFGKREASYRGITYVAEVRSVNHRFREVVTRVPRGIAGIEDEIKALVAKHCSRGRIEVNVSNTIGSEQPKAMTLNRALAQRYHHMLRELQKECKLPGTVDVALLAGFRDIFQVNESPDDFTKTDPLIKRIVAGALNDLDRMRCVEGKALTKDIIKRLQHIRDAQQKVRRRVPLVVRGHFERMQNRVAELMGSVALDAGRLHQELAQFADRCDVSEELTRLDSHIEQFATLLKVKETVGRQLDFLLQEMGREVNTIGSKANDAEISKQVVFVKSELEKIREQVQNVE